MAASDKELKTKTGVVQRLGKELVSYIEELEDNRRRTAEVRASDDHSKLKQWENVCAETQGMIPDTRNRLQTAVNELKALLVRSWYTWGYMGWFEIAFY